MLPAPREYIVSNNTRVRRAMLKNLGMMVDLLRFELHSQKIMKERKTSSLHKHSGIVEVLDDNITASNEFSFGEGDERQKQEFNDLFGDDSKDSDDDYVDMIQYLKYMNEMKLRKQGREKEKTVAPLFKSVNEGVSSEAAGVVKIGADDSALINMLVADMVEMFQFIQNIAQVFCLYI